MNRPKSYTLETIDMTTLPKGYSRALAVIGRFNTTEVNEQSILVFSNDAVARKTGNLTAADLFHRLNPQLGIDPGSELKFGTRIYRGMTFTAPKVGGAYAMPLLQTSMLLDQASGGDMSNQEIGGRLVTMLLKDLDVVVRFGTPRFSKALLDVAGLYLRRAPNRRLNLNNQISSFDIDELFESFQFSDAVLRTLTVLDDDLPDAERAMEKLLEECAAQTHAVNAAQREAIVRSMHRLRVHILRDGAEDEAWKDMLGEHPSNETQREKMAWVRELGKNDAYHFELYANGEGPEGQERVGDSLVDYYNHYMDHWENVQKFVRAPILRSYLFLWIMSKYDGSTDMAPIAAFRRGVEGSKDRTYGESDVAIEKHTETARSSAQREVDEHVERVAKKNPEAAELMREMADSVLGEIRLAYKDDSTFKRSHLLQMIEVSFRRLGLRTMGRMGQIIEEVISIPVEWRSVYQDLLRILYSEGYWKENRIVEEIGRLASDKYDEKREILLRVAEAAAKGESLESARDAALEQFDMEYGVSYGLEYCLRFEQEQSGLLGEARNYTALARLDNILNGIASEVRDIPAFGVLPSVTIEGRLNNHNEEAIQRTVREQKPPRLEYKTQGTFESFEQLFGPDRTKVHAELQTNDGVVIARYFADKLGQTYEFDKFDDLRKKLGENEGRHEKTREQNVEAQPIENGGGARKNEAHEGSALDSRSEKLKVPELSLVYTDPASKEPKPPLSEIDPKGNVKRALHDLIQEGFRYRSVEEAASVVGKMVEYGRKWDELRDMYVGVSGKQPKNPEALRLLQRELRGLELLRALGAAPDRETRLGGEDISKTMPVMVEATVSFGDLDNLDLEKPAPDARTDAALGSGKGKDGSFELSAAFPAPDERVGKKMLEDAMSYHTQMCDSLKKVKDYLQDVSDLRAIAETMDVGKLIVVNATLEEYAELVGGQSSPCHLCFHHHPSLIYLAHGALDESVQSQTDVTEPYESSSDESRGLVSQERGIRKAWETIKENVVTSWEKPYQPEDPEASWPVVVSADARLLKGCPFPFSEVESLEDLTFRNRPRTQRILGRLDFVPKGYVVSDMRGGLVVDNSSHLMSLPAAMALAAFVRDETALGVISSAGVSLEFEKSFKKTTSIPYLPGEQVLGLLRRLWMATSATDRESERLGAFLLARIATLALMWRPRRNGSGLHRLCQEARLPEAAESGSSEKEMSAGNHWGSVLDASFLAEYADWRVTFLRSSRGQWQSLFVNQDYRLSKEEKVAIHLQGFGVDCTLDRTVEFSRGIRAQLEFLHI